MGMANVRRERGATILELGSAYASLDQQALENLGGVIFAEAAHANPPLLVLDLSQTRVIGSSFLEILVRAWKRLRQREGRMVLCAMQPFCTEVLRAAHLDSIWPSYQTCEEALVALAGCVSG
jgi:anti-anti-sigma factor